MGLGGSPVAVCCLPDPLAEPRQGLVVLGLPGQGGDDRIGPGRNGAGWRDGGQRRQGIRIDATVGQVLDLILLEGMDPGPMGLGPGQATDVLQPERSQIVQDPIPGLQAGVRGLSGCVVRPTRPPLGGAMRGLPVAQIDEGWALHPCQGELAQGLSVEGPLRPEPPGEPGAMPNQGRRHGLRVLPHQVVEAPVIGIQGGNGILRQRHPRAPTGPRGEAGRRPPRAPAAGPQALGPAGFLRCRPTGKCPRPTWPRSRRGSPPPGPRTAPPRPGAAPGPTDPADAAVCGDRTGSTRRRDRYPASRRAAERPRPGPLGVAARPRSGRRPHAG